MSKTQLTERELEYLECDIPMLSPGQAAGKLTAGIFASMAQAVFSPSSSYGKADRGLMKTVREIKYTKYKKAVLRKKDGCITDKDKKLLEKLNRNEFVMAPDTYDPDEFTRKVYEEYMNRVESEEQNDRKRTDR